MRFAARDLGPFRDINIDFSDGNGKPHLGPHIFAGVNGSGKSSILKALAMMSIRGPGAPSSSDETLKASEANGFNFDSLMPLCRSSTLFGVEHQNFHENGTFATLAAQYETGDKMEAWSKSIWAADWEYKGFGQVWRASIGSFQLGATVPPRGYAPFRLGLTVAYAPSIRLKHSPREQFSLSQSESAGDLAFESTVDNTATQQWIVDLFSKKAIAHQFKQSGDKFDDILKSINDAIIAIYGHGAQLEIDVESLEPRLNLFGRLLIFSQLPQGVSSTLGWIVDFHRRRVRSRSGQKTGTLIIDEVEAYLHPRWQRRILPALQSGLPGVQIIVASHSPFVIASCPNARIHMLSLDETTGEAKYNGATDAPIGISVNAILRDIFGVESRFDVKTEDQLNELNELRQLAQTGNLKKQQESRMADLAKELSARSEELKFLVGPILAPSDQSNIESRFLPPAAKQRKPRSAAQK